MSQLTVATFNVNSVRSRLDILQAWLERTPVDVLGLQETKVRDEDFPLDFFADHGYACEIWGQKSYNGVALCGREPFSDVRCGFEDAYWDEQKRIISAKVQGVSVINVYCPRGDFPDSDKFHYKMGYFNRLIAYLEKHHKPDEMICVMGDMNVASSPLDLWNPDEMGMLLGTLPEERAALEKLLNWGLADAFRSRYPAEKGFTWWDYMGGGIWKDQGMRIDYMLVSRPLLDKMENITVDVWPRKRRSPKPSDHTPLVAVFDL